MVSNRTSRLRGSRTYGRGRKAGRGAGKIGGAGRAGLGKHKKMQIHKHTYFGRRGFTRPFVLQQYVSLTLDQLEYIILNSNLEIIEDQVLDLNELFEANIKLLGSGSFDIQGINFSIKCYSATQKAVNKLQNLGVSIEIQ